MAKAKKSIPSNSQKELIEASKCDVFNKFLSMKKGHPDVKRDIELMSHTVLLCDNYSADFRLINGDKESGPYLDVVLYDAGQEVQVLPPDREKLEGIYQFYDSIEKRELSLIIERC